MALAAPDESAEEVLGVEALLSALTAISALVATFVVFLANSVTELPVDGFKALFVFSPDTAVSLACLIGDFLYYYLWKISFFLYQNALRLSLHLMRLKLI